jgi:hypothetical protein
MGQESRKVVPSSKAPRPAPRRGAPPFPRGAGRLVSRSPCAALLGRFGAWAPLSHLELIGAWGLKPRTMRNGAAGVAAFRCPLSTDPPVGGVWRGPAGVEPERSGVRSFGPPYLHPLTCR